MFLSTGNVVILAFSSCHYPQENCKQSVYPIKTHVILSYMFSNKKKGVNDREVRDSGNNMHAYSKLPISVSRRVLFHFNQYAFLWLEELYIIIKSLRKQVCRFTIDSPSVLSKLTQLLKLLSFINSQRPTVAQALEVCFPISEETTLKMHLLVW